MFETRRKEAMALTREICRGSSQKAQHEQYQTDELSKSMSSTSEEERSKLSKVSYTSSSGSLMYAMVCTRLDIT